MLIIWEILQQTMSLLRLLLRAPNMREFNTNSLSLLKSPFEKKTGFTHIKLSHCGFLK
uniref:Uncharacterized protein n=1 Tax=Anguilla anguilla TaxID=7936 RepID=A0A0E9W9F8_ANGAN